MAGEPTYVSETPTCLLIYGVSAEVPYMALWGPGEARALIRATSSPDNVGGKSNNSSFSCYFWSTNYVPGAGLGALRRLPYVALSTH